MSGFGILDEIRIDNDKNDDETSSESKVIRVIFSRLLEKGADFRNKIESGEDVKVTIMGNEVSLAISDVRASGGGRSTGTSNKPSEKESTRGGQWHNQNVDCK